MRNIVQLPQLVGQRIGVRSYASSRSTKRLGATLSLEHFIQRQRALSLWREILRGTKNITNPTTRREMQQHARAEFERNRNVTDIAHIRYLISTGKTEWQAMERYVYGL